MRACVFPFDTCWLIESIRLPLFISFFSSRLGCCGGRGGTASLVLTGPHLIFRDRDAFALTQTPPVLLAALSVFSPVSFAKKNEMLVLLVTWWPGNTEGLLKQTECRCLWCGKKGCGQKRSEQMKGWGGDNKLFANQATMSAIALLDWMQQAWLFQPDYWSMWTHIFPAMGEEAVMTKPMPLPLLLSLTVPSCSSSTSVSHPVLISCLICARYLFFFFFVFFFPPLRSFSFGLIVYNTRWHYFHPLSEWNEKHLGDVQSRPAVKSFERSPPFRENPNWKPGAPEVTTNKLENAQARNEYRCDLIQKNLKQFP